MYYHGGPREVWGNRPQILADYTDLKDSFEFGISSFEKENKPQILADCTDQKFSISFRVLRVNLRLTSSQSGITILVPVSVPQRFAITVPLGAKT